MPCGRHESRWSCLAPGPGAAIAATRFPLETSTPAASGRRPSRPPGTNRLAKAASAVSQDTTRTGISSLGWLRSASIVTTTLLGRRGESRRQGRPEAAVGGVGDHAKAVVALGEVCEEPRCLVGRAVVDHQQLVGVSERAIDVLDESHYHRLLVVRRGDDGEGHRRTCSAGRAVCLASDRPCSQRSTRVIATRMVRRTSTE